MFSSKNSQKDHLKILVWLITLTIMTFIIIIIGGLTRLTESGLSIVDWNPIMGTLPPFTSQTWIEAFDKYKATPEFIIVNKSMNLEEFKYIYWWEWFHRFFARLIGIVFVIPFIYFIIKKKLSKKIIVTLIIVLLFGFFQAFIGWWMVKSGLLNNPYVSAYRLAFHFTNALIIFAILYWLSLSYLLGIKIKYKRKKIIINLFILGLFFVFLTMISGTFMAGTEAGKSFNTFPLMNGSLIPDDYYLEYLGWKNSFENTVTINFNHRWLAILSFSYVFILIIYLFNDKKNKYNNLSLYLVLISLFIQFCLGILTLVYKVNLVYAILHQTNAVLLLASMIFAYYKLIYK